ncbi:hypothetical protein C0J52_23060 [Blattella germanica]|nr:hypothetical protein C0J52_23060 [Blattella germanica]
MKNSIFSTKWENGEDIEINTLDVVKANLHISSCDITRESGHRSVLMILHLHKFHHMISFNLSSIKAFELWKSSYNILSVTLKIRAWIASQKP